MSDNTSKVTAIVGAQWGDEGKGKITDFFAREADLVVRFHVLVLDSDAGL